MKKWTFCGNWRRAMKRTGFASRGCANGLRGVALFLCVILGGMWASAATTAQRFMPMAILMPIMAHQQKKKLG